MRLFAIAAIAGFGMAALSGPAAARVWTDPNGRLTFDAPAGWTVEPQAAPDYTYVLAFSPDRECHFVAMPGPGTATAPANLVRTASGELSRFDSEKWLRIANSVPPVFPEDSAAFVSQSVDTAQFWPIQRAELRSPERAVHGAIQLRPGVELWTFCMTYDGPDSAELYDAVIRSVGTPTDAALQADAERQDAEAAAAAAAPPPPPPAPAAPPRPPARSRAPENG